jgi:hypothetical protein
LERERQKERERQTEEDRKTARRIKTNRKKEKGGKAIGRTQKMRKENNKMKKPKEKSCCHSDKK